MKFIKLNDNSINTKNNGYKLDPNEEYVINIGNEIVNQQYIYGSFQIFGPPPALKNYHAWLYENGFSITAPEPTNECVASYYGAKPLWITPYSIGIVVKDEDEDDYYIVMECSGKNKGYVHTQIVLTLGGCY